jgi:hypothetical protein
MARREAAAHAKINLDLAEELIEPKMAPMQQACADVNIKKCT